jgi:hypothetical protein
VEVRLKSGQEVRVSESVYHRPLTQAMAAAVVGLNRFLLDDNQPRFVADYQSSDNDVAAMIPMALVSPFIFWVMLRLWVSRSVEIDRAARSVRVRVQRKFHRPTDETFAFDDVVELSFYGPKNWGWLSAVTRSGPKLLLAVPWAASTRAALRELSAKLIEILGVPFNVSDDVRRRCEL